jgi:hypothetical protein
MCLGRLHIGWVGVRGDLAEEAEHPGLVATLLLPMGEVEGAPGDPQRIVRAAGQEMRLSEVGEEEWMMGGPRRCGVGQRLFQEGYALGEAPRQRIRVAEVPSGYVEDDPHRRHPA